MSKNKLGNCLEVSFGILMNFNYGVVSGIPKEALKCLGLFGEPKMAQGLVWHDETKWHLHSWVEDDVFCYDFSNGNAGIVLHRDYYRLGKIKDVKRYSYKQAALKALESDFIEFWDFKDTPAYKQNLQANSIT